MVTYLYNVGNTSGYSSIQHVINNIEADLSTGEIVQQDIIVNIFDGTYAGFKFKDAATLPLLNTTKRIIIRSAGNYFPIIDFNQSLEFVGADLGSANPNITIEGLRFQFFSVGIRAALNCHNIKIYRCIISNNRNAGIIIDQSNNSQIIQCVVSNGDYGIVTRLCKNTAIIHNTVFLNGSITTEPGIAKSAIWCQQARDYGDQEHGTLYLIGNIAWNTSGTTLSLFIDDVERGSIKSNWNDWVVGDSSRFISLEDAAFYEGAGASPRRLYTSLKDWKSLGYDSNSVSTDPKFFVPVRLNNNRNKLAIDLTLLPVSPILGLVPSFFVDTDLATLWLPSYVDSQDISVDILKNSRQQSGTAIGANDKTSNAGFFGQDVLSSPLESNGASNCPTDPLLDLLDKKLDLWYPKYEIGYFYSHDREYYLYSQKKCVDIGQLAQTEFNLPSRVNTNKPFRLYVNGKKIDSDKYFDIRGDILVLYHKDLNIKNYNEEVELQYYVGIWGDLGLTFTETYVRFKIKEGKTRYFLDSDYYPRGPVVITDDMMDAVNSDLFCNREFKIEWDQNEQKAEIIFAQNSNLVTNSQFSYFPENPPIGWDTVGALVTTGQNGLQPIAGSYICKLPSGSYLQQEFPVNTGEHVFSIYSASPDLYPINYIVKYFDAYGRDLGEVTNEEYETFDDWNRVYITFGNTGNINIPLSQDDYPHKFIKNISVPDSASKLVLRLSSLSGESFVAAAQYEQASYPTTFHRQFYGNELTVEYETSSDDYYVDKNQSMSANISTLSDGFLFIPELPAAIYDGPDMPYITTLHEYKWKEGRKKILPWARTFGKDKLRKRILFHTYPQNKSCVASPVLKTREIKDIDLIPSFPVCLQNSNNPVPITIAISDVDNNPVLRTKVLLIITDISQNFPGYLHKKLYGAKQQLGQSIYGYTSNGGTLTFYWLPPSKEVSTIVRKVPKPSSSFYSGDRLSFIKTPYPVNLDYHGNVIILDKGGNPLPTKSAQPESGSYQPLKQGNYSIVSLAYPAVPGTVGVRVNGITYSETQNASPEENQFFIDYENSLITLPNTTYTVNVTYTRSYVFINQADTSKIIIFHDNVFGSYDDYITVGYDYVIKLTANIIDSSNSTVLFRYFDLVATNCLTSLVNNSSTHLEL